MTDRSEIEVSPVRGSAGSFGGNWSAGQLTVVRLLAVAAPLADRVIRDGWLVVQILMMAIAVTFFWHWLFALARRRSMSLDGIVCAALFTVMVSPQLDWLTLVVVLSFGVVIGEQIFGGRGRSFLSPVVVALAFFYMSYPEVGQQAISINALALLPAIFLMVPTGLLSWRLLAAVLVGYFVTLMFIGAPVSALWIAPGPVLFVTIFFVGDSVSAAVTPAGRLVYGFLAGLLMVSFNLWPTLAVAPNALVFAALMASILAPLVDQAAIGINILRRQRRYD